MQLVKLLRLLRWLPNGIALLRKLWQRLRVKLKPQKGGFWALEVILRLIRKQGGRERRQGKK